MTEIERRRMDEHIALLMWEAERSYRRGDIQNAYALEDIADRAEEGHAAGQQTIHGPVMPRFEGWNGWRVEDGMLFYSAYVGGGEYPISLQHLTTSAEMLDAIMQVAKQPWATDHCLAGSVRALNEMFQPQAWLCSDGDDKTMSEEKTAEMLKPYLSNDW